MADRYPLVVDSSNYRIEEIPAGDSLDLTGTSIKNANVVGSEGLTVGSGATVLSVGSNGLIGIGTTMPRAKLHIADIANPVGTATTAIALRVDGNMHLGFSTVANFIAFHGTYGDGSIGAGVSEGINPLYTHTWIGERSFTLDAPNIGSNPDTQKSELLLAKANDAEPQPSNAGPDRIRLVAPEIRFDTYSTNLDAYNITFSGIATAGTPRCIVKPNGYIGIGTTTPVALLHVGPNATAGIGSTQSVSLRVDGNVHIGFSTLQNYIAFHGTQSDGAVGAGVSESSGSLFTHTFIGERLYSLDFGGTDPSQQKSELVLGKANDPATTNPNGGPGMDRIKLVAPNIVFDTYSTSIDPALIGFAGVATAGTRRMEILPGGTVIVGAALSVGGALSKGSGSFRIDHPISKDRDLVHSFVEGPQADLIYRGTTTLVGGTATVNLDEKYGLIEGTWEALCRDPQVWVTSDDGWTLCKGSVSGATLTITAQDSACAETVSWLVIAERQDDNIKGADWTDENGRPILEPLKA